MGVGREVNVITQIRQKIGNGRFEYSQHATDQSIIRNISVEEVRDAITTCELIESYPEDKFGPSCLVLGFTAANRPLHIHCSYPSRAIIKLITLYEPDPARWIDFRVRRSNHE